MTVKVISLVNALDRRAHIAQELDKQAIEFDFFDAITPGLIQSTLKSLDLQVNLTSLTKGEAACLLSHVVLWHNMIHSNQPYLTVLEDDVHLGANAAEFLSNNKWIPSNTHIIKIETFLQETVLSFRASKIVNARRLHRLKAHHIGTAGYILSLDGAKSLLNLIKSSITPLQPIDHIMFDDFLQHGDVSVYQLVPGLVIQDTVLNKNFTLPSSLEAMRAEKTIPLEAMQIEKTQHPKLPMPFNIKLAREVLRPLKQIFNFLTLKKFTSNLRIVEFE